MKMLNLSVKKTKSREKPNQDKAIVVGRFYSFTNLTDMEAFK